MGSSHQEIATLRARVETVEQQDMVTQDSLMIARDRITLLQISLGAAQIDITDLLESHRVDRLEMAELRSRAHDIEVILWEIERHLGP
ncbi:hypothetical protein Tco_1392918 [Tanacetum coccineum]